ncbi:MAG: hypothetical protein J6O00_03560 [Clostridiales bacterium]|nr:hypothetical protein [Clostridiales bacterium]
MATASFGRKFYVSKDNIDSFVETVTASPSKGINNGFKSHAVKKEQLQTLIKKNGKR